MQLLGLVLVRHSSIFLECEERVFLCDVVDEVPLFDQLDRDSLPPRPFSMSLLVQHV